MKLLLIYDGSILVRGLGKFSSRIDGAKCDLLPLVENLGLLETLKKWFTSAGSGPVSIHHVSRQVKHYYGIFGKGVGTWAVNISNLVVGGRSVKEWFVLRGQGVSSWWFGLFAERNPGKTDTFIQIAQINAIEDILKAQEYDECVIAVNGRSFRRSIISLLKL